MKAYVFPGQGSQFVGMGKDLFDRYEETKKIFKTSDKILGFKISEILLKGSKEALQQTRVTQPAIYIHSVISAMMIEDQQKPDAVAGHSLGEFSALTAAGIIDFASGLQLVSQRAEAMQKACNLSEGSMAAVLGLEDEQVETVCKKIMGTVVAANYNCPGQLVISGTKESIALACEALKAEGARRALILPVGGAFHSPLMEPAREELANAINNTKFTKPVCPIYQNTVAKPVTDPDEIQKNLIDQLTAPVKWTQSVNAMKIDGISDFIEVGPGKVLQGLIKKIYSEAITSSSNG